MMQFKSDQSVTLLQHAGSDEFFVQAARTSFANNSKLASEWEEERKKMPKDETSRLIRYLLAHRHEAPFEHSLLTFAINVPLFVQAQLVRHRIGVSISQESHRYVEPGRGDTNIYMPDVWRAQSKSSKQGSSNELVSVDPDYVGRVVHEIYSCYKELVDAGVAKEQARAFLPTGTYTSVVVSFNVRSLLHLLDLRLDPHAQLETRELAQALLSETRSTRSFDLTLYWWGELRKLRTEADAHIFEQVKAMPHPAL